MFTEYEYENFVNQNNNFKLDVARTGDISKHTHLIFESNITDINEFKNKIKNNNITLEIGGTTIYQMKLDFLMNFNDITYENYKFILKIPDFLNMNLYHCLLPYNIIRYIINYNNNDNQNIEKITLFGKKISLSTEEKNKLVNNLHDENYQILYSNYSSINTNSNQINIKLMFDNLIKGYFIQGNINELDELKIQFNGQIYNSYDKLTLSLISKKINENLIYIPFNDNFKYDDTNLNSFDGAVNHSRIDNVVLKFKFSNIQKNINIFGLSSNALRYRDNMFASKYAQNNIFYEPFDESKWIKKNKIIDITKNDHCLISYEEFTPNCEYCECGNCKNNFAADSILTCFEMTTSKNNFKCPMCITLWDPYVIYINKED